MITAFSSVSSSPKVCKWLRMQSLRVNATRDTGSAEEELLFEDFPKALKRLRRRRDGEYLDKGCKRHQFSFSEKHTGIPCLVKRRQLLILTCVQL